MNVFRDGWFTELPPSLKNDDPESMLQDLYWAIYVIFGNIYIYIYLIFRTSGCRVTLPHIVKH